MNVSNAVFGAVQFTDHLRCINAVLPVQAGEADVARVISDWTGIPLTKLVETEMDKVIGSQCAPHVHRVFYEWLAEV